MAKRKVKSVIHPDSVASYGMQLWPALSNAALLTRLAKPLVAKVNRMDDIGRADVIHWLLSWYELDGKPPGYAWSVEQMEGGPSEEEAGFVVRFCEMLGIEIPDPWPTEEDRLADAHRECSGE